MTHPQTSSPHLTASLRHVVEAATLAPSVHNTQPWRFELRPDGFDLHADTERRLTVLDPDGRQLHVSCGAALATARTAARALGLDSDVELLPDASRPALLARVVLRSGAPAQEDELALALAVLKRHTVREAFAPQPVEPAVLEELRLSAESEGAALRVVSGEDDMVALAVLLAGADADEARDPAYWAELTSWVHDGDRADGIPVTALPAEPLTGSSLRVRDFRPQPARPEGDAVPVAQSPAVVVLTTAGDGPRSWLQAGQALGAVLLHAAARGVQAQPLGQVVDLPGPRWALRAALGLTGTPQMVLRMGYAEATAATPRRDVADVAGDVEVVASVGG